jgi:biopolymer transport protein ExbB/TolQ
MDEDRLILGLLLISAASTSLALVATYAWRRAARRAQQFQDHVLQGRHLPAPADVETLTEQLDALATRVEQLAEGHHFLCRMLSRQRPVSSPVGTTPVSLPTPH